MNNLLTKARSGFYGLAASALTLGVVSPAHADLKSDIQTKFNSTAGKVYGSTPTQTDLPTVIGSVINVLLGLLGVILVVLIIYAGFLWMTAQGNEDKVKKAKSIISNAVIGMVLIFAAYALTQFVLTNLINATVGGS